MDAKSSDRGAGRSLVGSGTIVVTTIQAPTPSLKTLAAVGLENEMPTIVVGDRKTPNARWPDGVEFLAIDSHRGMELELPQRLPENHYARKNVGYLASMSRGAGLIFDTDDDNAPLLTWRKRTLHVDARSCVHRGWVNAYRWFTNENIWPRGLPLEAVRSGVTAHVDRQVNSVPAPIQQGLANGSPDVDAVWRLVVGENITFGDGSSVMLGSGTWSPFNSQSTWWFPDAFPLMYLPSFVSFRMTDIWRSFVAQRCLWAMGWGVVFHGAEVYQERNIHSLLRDFEQEIPGYLNNERIRRALEDAELSAKADHTSDNLLACYKVLVAMGVVPEDELDLLEAWIRDVKRCMSDVATRQGVSK